MKKIGLYEIRGLLGKGGMGRVYKVRAPGIGRMLALKRLEPHDHLVSVLGPRVLAEIFTREARILAGIRHPHIAVVLDVGHDDEERPFFVMEYCCMNLGIITGEHGELERPARILPPRRAMKYIRQALDGLERLHCEGIIHRDIKPDNLLLTENDGVKIIDLGLSLIPGDTRRYSDQLKIGTPYYAPPEQEADPDSVDARADLFSLGMVAWRMLAGVLPVGQRIKQNPGNINPVLGRAWDLFLNTAVRTDPEHRFQNIATMRDSAESAFEDWVSGMEASCRLTIDADNQKPGKKEPAAADGFRLKAAPLRRHSMKIDGKRAREGFNLNENWRPVHHSRLTGNSPTDNHLFRRHSRDPEIILDGRNGRVWEKSGSLHPVSWNQADARIARLNRDGFAGYRTWRLPVIDELLALIRPSETPDDFCQPELFDTRQNRLWSGDRRSYVSAWFVDTETGFVGSMDTACKLYVRAVADQ
jgi:serine/threonine protein kinase